MDNERRIGMNKQLVLFFVVMVESYVFPEDVKAEAGSVEGIVVTEEGNPVPGYPVIIDGPSGQTVVLTSPTGGFVANDLPAGDYTAIPANELGQSIPFSIGPIGLDNCWFFCRPRDAPVSSVEIPEITIPQNWQMN